MNRPVSVKMAFQYFRNFLNQQLLGFQVFCPDKSQQKPPLYPNILLFTVNFDPEIPDCSSFRQTLMNCRPETP
jgi:hypothetical protein